MFSVSDQAEAAVVDAAGRAAPASTEFLWGENQKSPAGPAEGVEAGRPLVEDQLPCKATRIQASVLFGRDILWLKLIKDPGGG